MKRIEARVEALEKVGICSMHFNTLTKITIGISLFFLINHAYFSHLPISMGWIRNEVGFVHTSHVTPLLEKDLLSHQLCFFLSSANEQPISRS